MHLSGTLLVRLSSTLCHIPIKDEHFLLLELLILHKNNGKKDGLTYKKVLFMTINLLLSDKALEIKVCC